MISLVIFDCDGVLVDSEMLAADVMSSVLCSHSFTMSAEDVLTTLVGLDTKASHDVLEARFGRPLPADFEEQVTENLYKAFTTKLRALAGIETLLTSLQLPFCVASNSDHSRLALTFSSTGLAPLLSNNIFSAEDVANAKPAPDLFLHAANTMGGTPAEECIVIEDSVTGVRAAVVAGMRVIGFCGGSHIRSGHAQKLLALGAERIVTSHHELSEILQSVSTTPTQISA